MFKVGDKVTVKRVCSGCIPGEIYELKFGSWDMFNLNLHEMFAGKMGMITSGCSCESNWELVNNNLNKNMGLTEKFLSSLKKEPEKSFRKAGITNGDDIPTDEGVKLICTVLLQKNEEVRKELTKIAKDILDEEEKK